MANTTVHPGNISGGRRHLAKAGRGVVECTAALLIPDWWKLILAVPANERAARYRSLPLAHKRHTDERTSSLLPTANRMVSVSLAIQILTTKCDRSSVGSARLIFQKIVIRLLTARPITGRWLIRDYKTRPLWQVQSKFEFGPAHDEPALLAIYQTRDVVVSRQLCDPVVGR
jgi:hypothetical protein